MIKYLRNNNLSKTIRNGLYVVLLVPICNITSGAFFNNGLIKSYISSTFAPGKVRTLAILPLFHDGSSLISDVESPACSKSIIILCYVITC